MYSVAAFGRMIADEVRTGAYEAALRASVRPGDVVLDIGCGTGILSLLACRFGARRVYAVEAGDAIAVAREIVHANGLDDRIELMHAKSTDITLQEQADVIVSDLRGVLPLLQAHIPSIADARQRHLKPGGTLIPQRDDLWLGLAEAPAEYERVIAGSTRDGRGFNMDAARRVVTNTWERAHIGREQLVGAAQPWVTLDYTTIESPDLNNTVSIVPDRAAAVHGIVAWFDATLRDGIGYSNAPGNKDTVYGRGFFPLSDPLDVQAGDLVEVTLRADLVSSEYVWSWDTAAFRGDAGRPYAHLQQSTFFGGPMPIERVRRRASVFTPALNQDGNVDAAILQAMTGYASAKQIADDVFARFPNQFKTRAEALTRVSDLSEKYSR